MKYSDKLNGYWEEGYHYYLEFRDDHLLVRGYDKGKRIETTVSYDADKLEAGERTVITLENNILSRDGDGEMMTEIKELAYEDGELKMLYNYTIMGETLYTLKKVDGDPFRNIIIRDDEFLDKLQGEWAEWKESGEGGIPMIIDGNNLSWFGGGGKFHVVSYTHDKDAVYLVPEDLIKTNFGSFTSVRVYPDKLTTTMMVCDMSMPLSVFARKDMLDKIEIPGGAKVPPRNTMMNTSDNAPGMMGFIGMGSPGMAPMMGMAGMMGMAMAGMMNGKGQDKPFADYKTPPMNDTSKLADGKAAYCPKCGYKFEETGIKFCPECGAER